MGFTNGFGRIVVDTSIWISFFNRPTSVEKRILDDLLDRDEVVLVGVVVTELLQGVRSKTERDTLHDLLMALPFLEMTFETWLSAGDLSSVMLRKGRTLGFPHRIGVRSCNAISTLFPLLTLSDRTTHGAIVDAKMSTNRFEGIAS